VRRLAAVVLGSAIMFSACTAAAQTAARALVPTQPPTATPSPTLTPAPTPVPTTGLADAGWTVVAPDGDGFTSKFPGAPKRTTTTQSTRSGPTPTTVWEFLANSDLDYNVALWQYPAGATASMTPSTVYDAAISGMDSTNGLTLGTQSDITLSRHPGRAFTLNGPAYALQGELVLAGDNLYMVYASYAPTVDTAGVTAFIADFHLTA
jgi:hypothetical protein